MRHNLWWFRFSVKAVKLNQFTSLISQGHRALTLVVPLRKNERPVSVSLKYPKVREV